MRITKGMLNKHNNGLIPSRKSLLDQVKSTRAGGSSRLNALNVNNGKRRTVADTAASRYQKAGYERLENAASSLEKQAHSLGGRADLKAVSAADVESLLENYNTTLKNLYQCDGSLNHFYRQTLTQAAADNLDALSRIGISCGKDGALSLNRNKLSKADGEEIKAALGSGSGFIKRLGFVASRVADSASANMRTASSSYNAGGNLGSSYFSRYNFLG